MGACPTWPCSRRRPAPTLLPAGAGIGRRRRAACSRRRRGPLGAASGRPPPARRPAVAGGSRRRTPSTVAANGAAEGAPPRAGRGRDPHFGGRPSKGRGLRPGAAACARPRAWRARVCAGAPCAAAAARGRRGRRRRAPRDAQRRAPRRRRVLAERSAGARCRNVGSVAGAWAGRRGRVRQAGPASRGPRLRSAGSTRSVYAVQTCAPGREPVPGAPSAGNVGAAVAGDIAAYLSCLSCVRHARPGAAKAALPSGGGSAATVGGAVGAGSAAAQPAREGAASEASSPRGGEGRSADGGPGVGHPPRECPVVVPEHAGGEAVAGSGADPAVRRAGQAGQSTGPKKKRASLGCWLERRMAALRGSGGPGRVVLCFDASSEDWRIEGFTNCHSLFWGGRWATAGAADPGAERGLEAVVDACDLPPADRRLKEWIKPAQRDPFLRWVTGATAEPRGADVPSPRVFGEPLSLRPPSLRNGRVQFVASVSLAPPLPVRPGQPSAASLWPPADRAHQPGAAVRILFEDIGLKQLRRRPEEKCPVGRGRSQEERQGASPRQPLHSPLAAEAAWGDRAPRPEEEGALGAA
ncbi:unnamed protein product [Prorocentrum cordatum]|uniref:Uncharacterized protein n=1 Tax=Prorocentrum cordatum TaxID=2364126 RepID=A0ABN9TT74_9DINO|nr:unnamed protein product [Polarella glacialis]